MKEYIDLKYDKEKLDLTGKQLERVVIKSDILEILFLNNNKLKEISLECPNLYILGLKGNPYNIMKISLTNCFEKQEAEIYLEDFFEEISSPTEEEILVFKVITGYECPWAYALTRYLYK